MYQSFVLRSHSSIAKYNFFAREVSLYNFVFLILGFAFFWILYDNGLYSGNLFTTLSSSLFGSLPASLQNFADVDHYSSTGSSSSTSGSQFFSKTRCQLRVQIDVQPETKTGVDLQGEEAFGTEFGTRLVAAIRNNIVSQDAKGLATFGSANTEFGVVDEALAEANFNANGEESGAFTTSCTYTLRIHHQTDHSKSQAGTTDGETNPEHLPFKLQIDPEETTLATFTLPSKAQLAQVLPAKPQAATSSSTTTPEDIALKLLQALQQLWFAPFEKTKDRLVKFWGQDPYYVLQLLFLKGKEDNFVLPPNEERDDTIVEGGTPLQVPHTEAAFTDKSDGAVSSLIEQLFHHFFVQPLSLLFELDVETQKVSEVDFHKLSNEGSFLREASSWTAEVVSRGVHKLPHLKRLATTAVDDGVFAVDGDDGEQAGGTEQEGVVEDKNQAQALEVRARRDNSATTTELDDKKARMFSVAGWGVLAMTEDLDATFTVWARYLRKSLGLASVRKPFGHYYNNSRNKAADSGAGVSSGSTSEVAFSKVIIQLVDDDGPSKPPEGTANNKDPATSSLPLNTFLADHELLALARACREIYVQRIQEQVKNANEFSNVLPEDVMQKLVLAGKKMELLLARRITTTSGRREHDGKMNYSTSRTSPFDVTSSSWSEELQLLRQILFLLDEAVHDEKMVPQLYFSLEFTTAVYLPVVLPALVPLLTLLKRKLVMT
ncbi:unnamed protein product [Amoebophrya sp. A120]|nr:unnamed protein product [Amoebophrya sp. A120]|eukprot:GSA120T00015740001.1